MNTTLFRVGVPRAAAGVVGRSITSYARAGAGAGAGAAGGATSELNLAMVPCALAVGTAVAVVVVSGSPLESPSPSVGVAACLSWTDPEGKKVPKFFPKDDTAAAEGGGGGGGGGPPTPTAPFRWPAAPAGDFRVRTVARYPSSAGATATTTTARELNALQPMPTAIHFYDSM